MIKAVVFDLDDTLFLEKDYINSGFYIISKKISKDFKKDENIVFNLLCCEFKASSINVFNNVLDILKVEYDDNYIKELVYEYRYHQPHINLTADSKMILTYLYERWYKLGIITDGYKEVQQKKIEALNIEGFFNCIILTDELGREYWKPHERAYILMKEKLGVEFYEMVYIGDNVTKDFVTAKKLGIKTIQIKRTNCIYSDIVCDGSYLPDEQISNFEELPAILESDNILSLFQDSES